MDQSEFNHIIQRYHTLGGIFIAMAKAQPIWRERMNELLTLYARNKQVRTLFAEEFEEMKRGLGPKSGSDQ